MERGTVGAARPSDTAAIVGMAARLGAHHGDGCALTPEYLAQGAFGEESDVRILIAEAEGRAIGYAMLSTTTTPRAGANGLDLHHLFVEEGYRGRGAGKALVDACAVEARGLSCRYLTVGTHPDNHAARGFYEALHFMRRDEHPTRLDLCLDG